METKIIISLILAAAGIYLMIWVKKLSILLYKVQKPGFRKMFGEVFDWDSKWFSRIYYWAVLFSGVLLLIGAWSNYFGPIRL